MELISVIVPAYNAECTIERCVASILRNCLSLADCKVGLQIVVVNDGSTDRTLEILGSRFKNNPQVLIVDQKNQGVAVARENGLVKVQGNYIAFCDADDWVDDDWLVSMYVVLKEQKADLVSFRAKINGNEGCYTHELLTLDRQTAIKEFLRHKRLNGTLWTKLFRARLFDDIHFDSCLRCFEDADVMWRILHKVSKIILVDNVKYNWTVSTTSLSNGKVNKDRLDSCMRLFQNIKRDIIAFNEVKYSDLVDRLFHLHWREKYIIVSNNDSGYNNRF